MLINEFDLGNIGGFSKDNKQTEQEYYWLLNRDKVGGGLVSNIIYVLKWAKKTKAKEMISISPVFKIIF